MEHKYTPEHIIAIARYKLGEKPSFSTGIDDIVTIGYGNLDNNGFWEFTIPYDQLNEHDKQTLDRIN